MSKFTAKGTWILKSKIPKAAGCCHKGIAIVKEVGTGETAICKCLASDENDNEVEAMKRLHGHPNIAKILAFIPVSECPPLICPSCTTEVPAEKETATCSCKERVDHLIVEYCKVPGQKSSVSTLQELVRIYDRGGADLPEAFVIEIFEGLLQAMAYMQHGMWDASAKPDAEWAPIYHGDLHSGNIFLHIDNGADLINRYPRIILADFGLSHISGFTPLPEYPDFGTNEARRLAKHQRRFARNDVVQLGQTMHGLCYQIAETFEEMMEADGISALGKPKLWKYSEELRVVMAAFAKRNGDPAEPPEILTTLHELLECKRKMTADGKSIFQALGL